MTAPAVQAMANYLTTPFSRGASTLTLSLTQASDATLAQVNTYDFAEYHALFNALPRPRYILLVQQDINVSTQVTIDFTGNSIIPSGSVTIAVPAGTLAGTSFAIDLNGQDDPDLRLQRVHMVPAPSDSRIPKWLRLDALLGNMAKLLWVIGWEKDNIRRHMEIVQEQHHLPKAVRYSLDWLGYDLGIPRFPPRPYSVDPQTIALYHLDAQTDSDPVEDVTVHYIQAGQTAHPATNNGAKSGFAGRFGTAYAFRNANAEVLIADHPDFNLDASTSFTVECFVLPDFNPPAIELQIDHREVLVKHPNIADTTKAGWALSVGAFQRGVSLNTRFLLSDGSTQVTLFADMSLGSDRFYHLAGVIDRATKQARLYIDGVLMSVQSIAKLGPLSNPAPVRIGRSPEAAFQGIIDEVRLSRVARTTFHPALGEDDEAYRGRLELFARWTLPTPSNLQTMLNDTLNKAGTIGGDTEPLIVNDTNTNIVGGTFEFTVQPDTIAATFCMDAQGYRSIGGNEADVNGTAAAETMFDPIYLMTHNDARIIYAIPATRLLQRGELPPDTHKMQLVVTKQLNQLLDLLGSSGKLLQVISAFDPRANDLRAVGRGLLLAPPPVPNAIKPERLAALAHRAGFPFVCNRADLGAVYVSTPVGNYIAIATTSGTATSANGFTIHAGETLNLAAQPALPPNTFYRWLAVRSGIGQASFTIPSTSQTSYNLQTNSPTITLNAELPGTVDIKVEVMSRRGSANGSITLHIGPADIPDSASIGSDGTQGVAESIAGTPGDAFFHPAYLVTHNNGRITYGGNINNRRMQPAVAKYLNQLLDLLAASTASAQLQIIQSYVPGATDLTGVGRALTLSHPTVAPGSLAVMAHAAGFTYVRRQGNQILVRQQADDLVTLQQVVGGQLANITKPQIISEKQTMTLTLGPRAAPHGIAMGSSAIYVTNSGTDTVSEIDPITGKVRRAIKVGWGPGAVVLSPDGKRLYTADTLGNTVTAVDVASGTIVSTLPVRPGPVALAHNPTTQRLYVLCQADNSLLEVDTNVLNVLNTPLAVGANPTGIVLTPDSSALWVASNGANQINVISTASPLALIGNVPLTQAPLNIALSPDGKRAYVTQPAGASIAILDVAGRAVRTTIALSSAGATSPNAVTVAPDNGTVYITDATTKNERLYVFDAINSVVTGSIRVQQEPFNVLAQTSSGTGGGQQQINVMVVNRAGNVISVIDPLAKRVANTWLLGSGLGESLSWILRLGPSAKAHLSSAATPVVDLVGDSAGSGQIRAVYELHDNASPYTFEVRLKPALEAANTIIRKEQYDLIMNILNAFHPIGVEVATLAIRERVLEVRGQLLNAFPDYTYPNFRVRGPLPRQERKRT